MLIQEPAYSYYGGNPKSGGAEETVYVLRKILIRLSEYVKASHSSTDERVCPTSYVAAWPMVKESARLIDIELKPDDLRHHVATYAYRSGIPLALYR